MFVLLFCVILIYETEVWRTVPRLHHNRSFLFSCRQKGAAFLPLQANSTCLWVEDNRDNFVDVQCNCSDGHAGRYCENDEDGCVGHPCFSVCTDVPAEQLRHPGKGAGYTCASCPAGFEGNGENCKGETSTHLYHSTNNLTKKADHSKPPKNL